MAPPPPPHEGSSPYACFTAENGHPNGEADTRRHGEAGLCSGYDAGPRFHGARVPPALDSSVWLGEEGWSEKERRRRARRCVEVAVKGFYIGAGLKGGLALFAVLARPRRWRKAGGITNAEVVSTALKDTLRYGLFLGTFAGTYVSMDKCIAALGGDKRTTSWRALLAGAVAGPSMLLIGPKTQHTSLAIYILMRVAVLASCCGIKSK